MRALPLAAATLLAGILMVTLLASPSAADMHEEMMPPIIPIDVNADPAFLDINETTDEASFVVHLYRWNAEYIGPYSMTFEVKGEEIAVVNDVWQANTRHVNVSTVDDADRGSGVWTPSFGLHWLNVTTEADGKDWTLPVRFSLGPDLTPTQLDTHPSEPIEGDPVTFEATIENDGTWATPENEPIPVTLLHNDEPLGEATITHVSSGEKVQITFEDAWIAIPGDHEFTLQIDPDAIDEITTSNNAATFTTHVEPAGLLIEHLHATPNPAPPTDEVTVTATITNHGTNEKPPATVHLATNDALTHETTTPTLAPQETTNITWTIQPPTGLHELQAALHPHDEDDPRAPSGPTTQLLVGPNLAIEGLTVTPNEPIDDEPFTVTATITNHGTTTDEAIPIVLHAQQDDGTGQNLDGTEIPGLTADERTQVPFNATLPPGTYTMTVEIDPLQRIQDATREMNTAHTDILVRVDGPDPILDGFHLSPQQPSTGTPLQIETQIVNQGAQPATGYNVHLINDTKTLKEEALPALDPGASTTITTTWVPTQGTHNLTLHIGTDTQLDKNAPHHAFTQEIHAQGEGPSLELSDLRTIPPNPTLGESAQALVNITNTGDQATGAFNVTFATNEDQETIPVENLEPGETTTIETAWTPTDAAWVLEATATPSTDNPRPISSTQATIKGSTEGTVPIPLPGITLLLITLTTTAAVLHRRT